MKKVLIILSVIASTLLIKNEAKSQSNNKTAIENLIYTYRDALNTSDANKVMGLYTTDGVLLPNAAPTAAGTEQVKATYHYLFNNFKFNLEFTISEIIVQGHYAFARSTSKGSYVIKASGQIVQDENREVFVFEKQKGEWKIASYMFNKSK